MDPIMIDGKACMCSRQCRARAGVPDRDDDPAANERQGARQEAKRIGKAFRQWGRDRKLNRRGQATPRQKWQ